MVGAIWHSLVSSRVVANASPLGAVIAEGVLLNLRHGSQAQTSISANNQIRIEALLCGTGSTGIHDVD